MLESLRGPRTQPAEGSEANTNTAGRIANLAEMFQRKRTGLEEIMFVSKLIGPGATLVLLRWASVEPTTDNFVKAGVAAGGTAAIFIADKASGFIRRSNTEKPTGPQENGQSNPQ